MFFLLFSVLRFSFVRLCTTNFSGFWFFWMAFSYTSVVHKYHLLTYSVRCKASFGLSSQEHSGSPWWQPSALTTFVLSLSSSMSHLSVWVCSELYWLSSMRAVQGRGGHPTGHLSCGVSAEGSSRSSTDDLYILLPQFGITECFIQYKCSVKTPPPHTIRSG